MKINLLSLFKFTFFVISANAQVSTNRLAAWHPFNGNANDSSGNSNNPIFNNATLTIDRFGNVNSAYYFDGNGSYMDIPNSPTLQLGYRATISLWVKPNAFYSGTCHGNDMVCKGPEANGSLDALFSDVVYDYSKGINSCNVAVDTSHKTFYSTFGGYSNFIHTNNWYNVVEVCDSNTVSFYVNGSLINKTIRTNILPFKTQYD